MLTTFHNVRIDIEAATPEKAYLLLCQLFEPAVDNYLEYTTDSFTTQEDPQVDRDTSELWPNEPERDEV